MIILGQTVQVYRHELCHMELPFDFANSPTPNMSSLSSYIHKVMRRFPSYLGPQCMILEIHL